jgi:uncharacterized membrane protein YidH (DUF202 family)
MIHLDTFHRISVIGILLFGIAVLYITWGTDTFIDRQKIYALPRNEQAKAIPLWVGLITAVGLACFVFAIDVLFLRKGLFR